MISFIDIVFAAIVVIIVFAGVKKGLVVSLLGMLRFMLIVPVSFILSRYIRPYVKAQRLTEVPSQLIDVALFFICLAALVVLTGVLMLVLKKLQKKKGMPLRNTNALLGGVFGFIKAMIIVFTLAGILGFSAEFLPDDNEFYTAVKGSFAVELINNSNLFDYLGVM